ncbi:MAG: hypothetical protein V4469_04400 [Patescibacteria group bacterium]
MSIMDQAKMPSLKDKHIEKAQKTAEAVEVVKEERVEGEVEVKVKKGRRLNK